MSNPRRGQLRHQPSGSIKGRPSEISSHASCHRFQKPIGSMHVSNSPNSKTPPCRLAPSLPALTSEGKPDISNQLPLILLLESRARRDHIISSSTRPHSSKISPLGATTIIRLHQHLSRVSSNASAEICSAQR
uniref:Uncharacterized protein n=1 Tax=Tetraselmis sp. GSL018 TaxID=582737 RepID=A0A061REA8_9CHLO